MTRPGALRIVTLPLAAACCALPADAAGAPSGPPAPAGVAIADARSGHARLVWSKSGATGVPVAGYRVYRDGRAYRRVRKTALRLSVRRAHTYRVAAYDADGRIGRKSRAVKAIRRHRAPSRPGRLRTRVSGSGVRLSWSRSRRGSGRIAGYRIYRDRVLVRQVRGRSARDAGLAAATRYRFTVAAIDTQGYLGPSTRRVAVRTARPEPTEGRVHAFLLASTGESFRDLQRHYRQIGTLYPTYFECREADAAIIGKDDRLVTRWAQLRKIQVHARIDCQRPAVLHSILTDTAIRSRTISRLVELVRSHGYEGINVDFENGAATDRDALTAFVRDLAARLHAIGKRLSVEVSAKYQHTTTGRSGFYDYEALGQVADRVFVMNWGWHWTTSAPGAPDDMALSRRVADYVATMPNRARYVLGTHMYGMDWPNGGGPANRATPLEYADVLALIARYGATPALDPASDAWTFSYADAAGVRHEVWYPDAATIARRVQLARERGLGIGFWRLGREDQRVWSDPQIAPGTNWP
ncbi:MAG: glycosyl hydrolase family 18 protein [Solirubrobacterales bacterium]